MTEAATRQLDIDSILKLTTDDILSAYSGKAGKCCCGCAGSHRYNPRYRELGNQRRGYDLQDKDVNLAQVKAVLKKVQANVEGAELDGDHVHVTVGSRIYIVYLTDEAAERIEAEQEACRLDSVDWDAHDYRAIMREGEW
jgi:hypothetical protein